MTKEMLRTLSERQAAPKMARLGSSGTGSKEGIVKKRRELAMLRKFPRIARGSLEKGNSGQR